MKLNQLLIFYGDKMKYKELRAIDVSPFIKKKGKLNYISWAVAIDQLLQQDPRANWEFPVPKVFPDGTMMVYCNLFAFGKKIRMHLPVLTGNNQPITNPNSFQTNTAMMRCLTKAVSCTGIGLLQIYGNEDLPLDEDGIDVLLNRISNAENMEELQRAYAEAYNASKKDKETNKILTTAKDKRKAELNA